MERFIELGKILASKRIVRALFVGVLGVLAQTIVFEIVGIFLKLTTLSTASLLGAEFGILTNFYLNRKISFHDRMNSAPLIRLFKFHLVVSGSVCIQWLSLFLAEHHTENLLILHGVYVASILVGFSWNYTWYTLWVWRHPTITS
jgi:putative flippase GtrA